MLASGLRSSKECQQYRRGQGAPNPKAIAEELQERWSQLSESKRLACHDEAAKNKANNFSAKTMFKGSFAAWAAELAEAGGLGRGQGCTQQLHSDAE